MTHTLLSYRRRPPKQLLSNRLNGVTACLLGLLLSVLLWRKFTTITLQQSELEKVNAELYARHRELEQLTRQDGLTGLFNRTTFAGVLLRHGRRWSCLSVVQHLPGAGFHGRCGCPGAGRGTGHHCCHCPPEL